MNPAIRIIDQFAELADVGVVSDGDILVKAGDDIVGSATLPLINIPSEVARVDVANTFIESNVFRSNNILDSFVAGISLTNETASTADDEVQRSPGVLWKGAGWDSAASFPHYFQIGLNPSAESAALEILYSPDGENWTNVGQFQNDGAFFADTIQTDNLQVSSIAVGNGINIRIGANADDTLGVKLYLVDDEFNELPDEEVFLLFNGATGAHPGIKRVGTELQAKLADDSAFTSFRALSFTGDGSNLTGLTKSQVGLANVDNIQQLPLSYLDTDVNLTANSDVKVPSQKAIKTYTDAAVAALVDSSPLTLDTLNELAAALGDDPNFATTIATSIGTKLAKASNLSDLTSASAARSNLGLVIGTDVQANLGFTPRNAAVAISLTADVSGVLPIANGGLNLSELGTPLQQIRVNAGGTALEYFTPSSSGVQASDSPTWTGNHIFSKNGASATPTLTLTGTWFTGGGTTNTKPHLLVEPAGATSAGWSANGTGIGVNADSGFVGHLLDLQKNGSFKFRIDSGGNITMASGAGISGTQNNSFIGTAGTGRFGNGWFNLLNSAVNDGGVTAVANVLTLGHQHSSGTPSIGMGSAILFNINSSSQADQRAARIAAIRTNNTHPSRVSDLVFYTDAIGVEAEAARMKSDTRFLYGVPNSAPTDADISNNFCTAYLDEAGNKLKFRVRYSDGSYKTGEVALT